jgi:hypothetical protein
MPVFTIFSFPIIGVVSCICDGLVHVKLKSKADTVFVPLTAIRTQPSQPLQLLPQTKEMISFFAKLLISATEEIEKTENFQENILRAQTIKYLQLRAARMVLSQSRDCLLQILISPVFLKSVVSNERTNPDVAINSTVDIETNNSNTVRNFN